MDSAALKQSSISFFDVNKHEAANQGGHVQEKGLLRYVMRVNYTSMLSQMLLKIEQNYVCDIKAGKGLKDEKAGNTVLVRPCCYLIFHVYL